MERGRVACITCDREIDAESDALVATLEDGERVHFCSAKCAAARVIAANSGASDYERPELQDWPPIVKTIALAIAENLDP